MIDKINSNIDFYAKKLHVSHKNIYDFFKYYLDYFPYLSVYSNVEHIFDDKHIHCHDTFYVS